MRTDSAPGSTARMGVASDSLGSFAIGAMGSSGLQAIIRVGIMLPSSHLRVLRMLGPLEAVVCPVSGAINGSKPPADLECGIP
jgi:hypothetical protein